MESSTQRVAERILEDAKERSAAILEEARSSGNDLLKGKKQLARKEAERQAHSLMEKARTEAGILRGRILADAKRKAGWMILSEKQRLAMKVLNEVRSRLRDLRKSKEYIKILERLVVDAGISLHGGALEVVLNKEDSSLPLRIDACADTIAKKTGLKTQLKISALEAKAAGVIVKKVDGSIMVDNTFEAILKRRDREFRLVISRILFKD